MFAARVNLRYILLPCVGLPLAIPFKSWPPLATINLQLHVQNASTPVIARCNKLKVASGAGWKGEPQPHALAQRQSVSSVAGSWSFCKIPTTTSPACELLARPLLHEVSVCRCGLTSRVLCPSAGILLFPGPCFIVLYCSPMA